jgi:aryl-alcohol dehydrogenase-like predicted oxidoreductase
MPDRVHAAVPRMQAAGLQPARDRPSPDAEREQLRPRHHPVLAAGERGYLARSTFGTYVVLNCNLAGHGPRLTGQLPRNCDGVQRNSDIPHRRLGGSDLSVSVLALGSWQTFERISRDDGLAVMRAAREHGIDFLDDARYHDEAGRSEVLFGELFRRAGWRRDEVVVANKLWWEFWPEQTAAAELDGSLARMGFDHIDLIYAELPPQGLELAELVDAVTGLIRAGKARAWGVLNWPAAKIAEAERLAVPPPCAAQLPYSLVRREWVENPEMERTAVSVVASAVLAGGALTGKYPGPGRLAGRLDAPEVARAVKAAPGAVAAIRFALAHPRVASVLFGATSPEQVAANARAIER